MYNLIIVDDDALICEEFSQIFDWETLGFKLAGTFQNGKAALGFIEKNHVDAVITDIKMPVMTGMELAGICHSRYPYIKVILLSAYRDFDYAVQSMKYNAADYILKPVSYNKVTQTMASVKKVLDETAAKKQGFFIDSALSLERQQFFFDFFEGLYRDTDVLQKKFLRLEIPVNISDCRCIVINMHIYDFKQFLYTKWHYGKEQLHNVINNLIPSCEKNVYFSIADYAFSSIKYIALNDSMPKEEFAEFIRDFSRRLQKEVSQTLGIPCRISTSEPYANIFELQSHAPSHSFLMSQANTAVAYIYDLDFDSAMQTISDIFNDSYFEIPYLKQLATIIFENLAPVLKPPHEKIGNEKEPLLRLLESYISEVIRLSLKKPAYNEIIEKSLEYISSHIGEDITRDDVAGHVGLSPIYFSAYFKQHTGEKFIDYLVKLRIEKSQELLVREDELKISYICELVGYKSMPYFYKVFRNYTGLTPAEYRKLKKNEGR